MADYEQGYEPDVEYEDDPGRSTIAAPLIRALLAAAVAFGVYALVFSDLGGGDLDVAADQTPTAPATAPSPADTPVVPLDPMPTGAPTDPATDAPTPGAQIGAGVTAQVIAGSNTTSDQVADAVSALREMGYEVTESGISPNAYPQTTVFATPGEESEAETLTSTDSRFTVYDPAFPGLNEQIQIHVLVGEDWPIGETAAPAVTATEG